MNTEERKKQKDYYIKKINETENRLNIMDILSNSFDKLGFPTHELEELKEMSQRAKEKGLRNLELYKKELKIIEEIEKEEDEEIEEDLEIEENSFEKLSTGLVLVFSKEDIIKMSIDGSFKVDLSENTSVLKEITIKVKNL